MAKTAAKAVASEVGKRRHRSFQDKRYTNLSLRISAKERDALTELAKKRNVSVSAILRSVMKHEEETKPAGKPDEQEETLPRYHVDDLGPDTLRRDAARSLAR